MSNVSTFNMLWKYYKVSNDLPQEWNSDLDVLCSKIDKIVQRDNISDFKILMIKNQHGSPKIYTSNANDEINDLIRVAEYQIGQ